MTIASARGDLPAHAYVTSLKRGKSSGNMYKLKLDTMKLARKISVRTDNPMAKHGGPHGLARIGKYLVTGTYSDILLFDENLEQVGSFTHPYLSGVHGITTDPVRGHIWVSSCNNDAVLCFGLDGTLVESHFLEEDERLVSAFGLPRRSLDPNTDYRRMRLEYADQAFHVNHVCLHGPDVLVCLHKQGVLWNLSQGKPYRSDLGEHIHDGQIQGDRVYANDTGQVTLRMFDETSGAAHQVDVRVPLSRRAKMSLKCNSATITGYRLLRKLAPWLQEPVKKSPHWLRGLAMLDATTVVVGLSPAALVFCDLNQGMVTKVHRLAHDVGEAVFGIHFGD